MNKSRRLAIEACRKQYPNLIETTIAKGFFIANSGMMMTIGFYITPPLIIRLAARIFFKWHWVTLLELRG